MWTRIIIGIAAFILISFTAYELLFGPPEYNEFPYTQEDIDANQNQAQNQQKIFSLSLAERSAVGKEVYLLLDEASPQPKLFIFSNLDEILAFQQGRFPHLTQLNTERGSLEFDSKQTNNPALKRSFARQGIKSINIDTIKITQQAKQSLKTGKQTIGVATMHDASLQNLALTPFEIPKNRS